MLKNTKVLSILVVTIMILSTSLTGCGNKAAATSGTQTKLNNTAKVLRFSDNWPAAASYVGNAFNPQGIGQVPYYSTFEGLFSYMGVTGEYFNRLCKSYENKDGKTTIHLQEGVKWNDGQPFTSKDIWSYYILNSSSDVTKYLAAIDIPDANTVVFTWQKPDINEGIKMRMIASQTDATVPYHIYGKYVDKAAELLKKGTKTTDISKKGAFGLEFDEATLKEMDANWKEFTTNGPKIPVGTGPFMVQKVTDSDLVMVKNPNYWQKDKVKFEQLQLKKLDANTAMASLKAGELDRADGTPSKDVLEAMLAGNKNLVHYMTLDNASVGMSFNIQKAPLNDPKVRQAFAYILDKTKIKNIGNYYGKVTDYATLCMPFSYSKNWIDSDVMAKMTKYTQDNTKATDLLKQAGWTKGSDGKWKDKTGKVPNLVIGVQNMFQFVNPAETAAEQLSAFGINVQAKVVDPTVFYGKAQTDHEYDMCVDWIDNAWTNFSPYGSLNQFYKGFAGLAGNFPLDQISKKLIMTYKGPDGKDMNIDNTLASMLNMNDKDMEKAGSDLAWIANQNVFAISFFQNASGYWYNSKTVSGLPDPELVTKYNRNVPIPTDPKQLEDVNKEWYLLVNQFSQIVDGTLKPN